MNSQVMSTPPSPAATVANGIKPCKCATGQVDCLRAFALLKTHSDNSKKTYIYVLEVRRSDGTEYQIHRSHRDLVSLANSLPRLKELVVQKKPKKTEVPRLPDRVERTKDLSKISKYFASLLPLQDENNVVSKELSRFCRQNSSCDICRSENVVAISPDKKSNLKKSGSRSALNISPPISLPSYRVTLTYTSDDKRQMSLQQNTIVQIYKKCSSGWWYVLSRDKNGWFPASYLEMIDRADAEETTPLETPERYKATCDYKAQNPDELSFSVNAIINVKLMKMDGWWLAECHGKEGYVPATYLRPCDMAASDCKDMCWETMDMKLTTTRSCSEDAHLKQKEEESRKLGNAGIDLMPEEEIIREETHNSESKAESVSLTLSNNTVCSNCNRSSENNRNNSIILCEEETQSSTSESNNEKERRTQL